MKYDIVLFSDNLQNEFVESVTKTHNIKVIISSKKNSKLHLIKNDELEIEVYNPTKSYDFEMSICILFLFEKIIDVNKIKSSGIFNFHYGLLPEWRGNSCNVWSLVNGVNFIGYSFHEVNNEIDDGDILYKYKIELPGEQTYFKVRESIIEHSIKEAPKIISKIGLSKSINNPPKFINYTPRAKYSDTIIDSFNIEVGLFNGMFKAFSGSDWGFNVKSRLGLMKILSIKIFNSKNNVNGFIGRVVNLIEIDDRKFTVVKVLNGYVYIGEVLIENEICDLYKLVKIGTQL